MTGPSWASAAAWYTAIGAHHRGTLHLPGAVLPQVPAPNTYNATVARVHDGDTITVDVQLGRPHGLTVVGQPVRLLGCNARELTQPGGPEARDRLAALLPAWTPVVLTAADDDKFAPRWDCQVTFQPPGGQPTDLVALLIADGWAAAWDGTGVRPVPPWPIPAAEAGETTR